MFENLTEKLEKAFKTLKGQGRITDVNIAATTKEIRKALQDADVEYKTAKAFTEKVKQKAMGMDVMTSVKPGELFIKITHDELVELMGSEAAELQLNSRPSVILMAGLNGSGKTTFSGKLANMLKTKQNKRVLLAACDTFRPAAIDQLQKLGEQIGVPVYTEEGNKNPIEIAQNAVRKAKQEEYNVVIVDTAGRLAVDEQLMQEIEAIKQAINPDETLFVVDAMTGQDAVNTARTFNERLDYTGIIMTKLDGDTRGGAAVSIRSVVGKPIKFVGTGEKMDAIDTFHPDRMASRILGMGDIVSFVERAQQIYDEKEAKELDKKIAKGQFDFDDFVSQIEKIEKMGNMKDLVAMIPGLNKAVQDVEIGDEPFKPIKAMISSMTPYERKNPSKINTSRRNRIARGSGHTVQDVNRMIKQFEGMSKMLKEVNSPSFANKMRGMQAMRKMGF